MKLESEIGGAGSSAIIKVRLRFIYKGEDFRNWSEWRSLTVTGS